MPRLGAFSIPGLDLFFNSLDHLPPHFHARRPGEWEIRVYFLVSGPKLACDIKWSRKARGMPASTLQTLNALVNGNRAQLFREWDAKVASGTAEIDE